MAERVIDSSGLCHFNSLSNPLGRVFFSDSFNKNQRNDPHWPRLDYLPISGPILPRGWGLSKCFGLSRSHYKLCGRIDVSHQEPWDQQRVASFCGREVSQGHGLCVVVFPPLLYFQAQSLEKSFLLTEIIQVY